MAADSRLALLKTDLGILGTPPAEVGEYLETLLLSAGDLIAREGIALDASRAEDDALCASYAAWLYRKRASHTDEPMPRMLRYALNLRVVGTAMGRGGEADGE